MSKRPAEQPLYNDDEPGSPAAKRRRDPSAEPSQQQQQQQQHAGLRVERQFVQDESKADGIVAAADLEQETIDNAKSDSLPSDADEDAGDESAVSAPSRQTAPADGYSDLYLDTVHRSVLDFDFEKLCSVSLANINVYACLVCGRYFQGRGPKSHAYFHALEVDHHVFINMETKKVYVLPEGYEVMNQSLNDIKYVVDPYYTKDEVAKLDKTVTKALDLFGKPYRPGFVGMNNIKANDYLNVIVQLLAHVRPIRNFFLLHHVSTPKSQLATRFGTLVRKLWNTRAFRNHVSPHELLQEIALRSSKRFTLTQQSDPVEFLSWFLNNLHLALGGTKKPTAAPTSVIQSTFQGQLKIESQAITARSDAANARLVFSESSNTTTQKTSYLMLTLDLPPTPLFQSQNAELIIPQVPLTTLLDKYNGVTATEKFSHRVRHRLLHPLPQYLLFHIKRFSRNKFVSERNPTIVTFPSTRGLDMSAYVEPNPDIWPPSEPLPYDLVANIILDADVSAPSGTESHPSSTQKGSGVTASSAPFATNAAPGAGSGNDKVAWRIQLLDKAMATENEQAPIQSKGAEWLEIQDLWVEKAESDTLFTKEGYLMVWERRKTGRTPTETRKRESGV